MRKKNPIDIKSIRKSMRTGVLLVIVAALTLEATSLIQNYFAQESLREEASLRAENSMETLESKIMNVIGQAETGVRNKTWIAQLCLNFPDTLARVSQLVVEDNPVIVGSTVALVPGYDRKMPLYAPYTFRSGDSLAFRSLATEAYGYQTKEWFTKPIELGEGYWSEPYFDDGGGDMLMTTYSIPVKDPEGTTAAVLTGDISLDWLAELADQIQIYPNSRCIMLSRAGLFMISPREDVVMTKTVQEVVGQLADSLSFKAVNRAMLDGESGEATVRISGKKHQVYYSPVERTGWSMCIIIPDEDIYSGIRRHNRLIRLFQILGLAMLILISRFFPRPSRRLPPRRRPGDDGLHPRPRRKQQGDDRRRAGQVQRNTEGLLPVGPQGRHAQAALRLHADRPGEHPLRNRRKRDRRQLPVQHD